MKKKTVSVDLIRIKFVQEKQNKSFMIPKKYTIVKEDDGYYRISLENETIIHTRVSDELLEHLMALGTIRETDDKEELEEQIKDYLIRSAQEFVRRGLHTKKQDRYGKIDIPGIDDEF